jgi:hypothetical protein
MISRESSERSAHAKQALESQYWRGAAKSKEGGAKMEAIISNLVSRFEKGLLSRRELVRGLAMLAAGGTVASA